jgi:hypothetical protein
MGAMDAYMPNAYTLACLFSFDLHTRIRSLIRYPILQSQQRNNPM